MPDATLTLVSHPLCPFVQRAAILLSEKDTPFERIDIDLAAKPDWFLALSPTGKVPLLKVTAADSTEAVLFESVAICEYLDETQDGASLYARDALSRARQRAWVEFGTGALADAWQFLNCRNPGSADAKRLVFHEKLSRVEGVLDHGPYFSGSMFGMVDAVFAPVFRYFDAIDPAVATSIFGDLPRVSAWRPPWRHAAASSRRCERIMPRSFGSIFATKGRCWRRPDPAFVSLSYHSLKEPAVPTPIDHIIAFCAACSKDHCRTAIRQWFTPETVWVNEGVGVTVGIDEAIASIERSEPATGVATVHFDLLAIAADGNRVLTERLDRFVRADGSEILAAKVMGIFEFDGDRIVAWRDYSTSASSRS